MGERLIVAEPSRLLAFLRGALPGWKRTTLEQRIRAGCVRVGGKPVLTNAWVAPGDVVEVGDRAAEPSEAAPPLGIEVLFVDEHLVAIDKPAGLLAVATDRETERTALALVRRHLSTPREPAKLWPVHRIDRETSGVLLFARSKEIQERVQHDWDVARKHYLALVQGRPEPPRGVIDQPLIEDRALFVRVGRGRDAKPARTRYTTLDTRGERSLVEVELETGRRHQIRAHFAWLGTPIVGDPRYGTPGDRLGLHAWTLELPHPVDGRPLELVAPPPKGFTPPPGGRKAKSGA
ncbi:MAG: RluA family pseudouridine synthase [Planctomycetes bacterium]|nr:RluA family pseudouridine synthase [Planctomycetota bacterium]